jgi:O-acetylhomoserine (thiol)-lyase
VFRDADHAAALFNLQEVGFIYSRLTNPTVAVLQERIATLEGGCRRGVLRLGPCRADHGAVPADGTGRNIVVSTRLYGGTVTQFSQTIKRFGWSARFVDFDDLDAVQAAIDDDTRAVFCEAIANPGGYITDLPRSRRSPTGPACR